MGDHPIDDAEIVEHLEGARLDALAARAGLRAGGGLDQAEGDAAAGELARQRQPGRTGPDDQHRQRVSHLLIRSLVCHLSDSRVRDFLFSYSGGS